MKKIFTALVLFAIAGSNLNMSAQAFTLFKKENKIKAYVKQKSSELEQNNAKRKEINEIKKLLQLLLEYSNAHDSKKVATLYDKNYKSFDGFRYDTFTKMLDEIFESYDDISYTSKVKDIRLYGDKAVVTLVDYTKATLSSPKGDERKKEFKGSDIGTGYLNGECNYALYLQKINGEWKIISDNIISEVTSVRYGEARDAEIDFSAPFEVPKNSQYCLTLKMKPEKGTRVVASLGKEEILYPTVEPKDVFRKIPKDGILERVVHSNKNGFNEYAIASVGITEMEVAEDFSMIKFSLTGLAFLMQRVNVYEPLNPVSKEKVKAAIETKTPDGTKDKENVEPKENSEEKTEVKDDTKDVKNER